MKEPVDAVITWVNGYDNAHQQKLANHLEKLGIARPESAEPTRYNQQGEIDYCVWSMLRFAPWIRNIYIVTDSQVPSIIKRLQGTPYEHKIKLVDHREIFHGFEEYLPTFNSLTIESVLWRIPGISNKFIYFNDDCAIIQPVTYEDFFRNQKVVLRGNWKVQSTKKWRNHFKSMQAKLLKYPPDSIEPEPPHRLVQEKSAQITGRYRRYLYLQHIPFAIRKSTLEDFFTQHPDFLKRNVQFPFRDPQQFWTVSLAHHLEINKREAVIDNSLKGITINVAFHSLDKIERRLARADKRKNVAFICLQSIDAGSPSLQHRLLTWLDRRISPLVLPNAVRDLPD